MRPHRDFLVMSFSLLFLSLFIAQTQAKQSPSNFSVSAIFVFGDSTVDPGNNDYIDTVFKSNFPPYGRDFSQHAATGRFSNGRLVTDFIASYVGVKEYVPPYLDSTLGIEELMTGVSFASAGSGFDPLTAQLGGAISIPEQLEYFREYKARVEHAIGKEKTQKLIDSAAFLISAGTNDVVVNYFGPPIRRKTYTVSSYQQFLIQRLQQLLQGLRDEGAQKMAVVGLPPVGCLPAVITVNSNHLIHDRGCIESLSSFARDYNRMLENLLKPMRKGRPLIIYGDIYTPLIDMIQGRKFGFKVVHEGCCGTGLLEASFLCNPKSPVCPDASKYVFWDAIHPTEMTYYLVFQSFRPEIDLFLTL